MAVGVIHFFKVVEIEIHQTDMIAVACGDCLGDFVLNGIAIGQAGNNVGIGQYPQSFLSATLFGDVGAGANQEHLIFTAAAVDELVAKQEQPFPLHRFDPTFHLIG
ncbi:hypothetical protein D3C72_1540600 [compost metagenome]